MIVPILLFVLGLLLLIKGGDWFVDGSVGVAKRFHIPELIIGATVVSIGTTLPEVMVSASAAVTGHAEIAYGNAIGSIICNTALISALTMAIRPAKIQRKTLIGPIIFFFAAAIIYAAVAYTTGYFNRIIGVILIAGFIVYMIFTIRNGKKNPETIEIEEEPEAITTSTGNKNFFKILFDKNESPLWKEILFLIVGAVCIAIGARLLVDNGTLIAAWMGVPESVIALTFVALGTSLPELVTAITSLMKGHGSLSLGNIIGANLFNIVLVGGVSMTLSPFHVPVEKTVAGMNASLLIDIPVMFLVMGILAIPPLIKGKVMRWQGIVLLLIYVSYLIVQFCF